MAKNTGGRSPIAIAKALKGMSFPASRKRLEEHARGRGADQGTLEVLGRLPDREYQNVADVEKGVGDVEG